MLPLFPLGQIVATPGALAALEERSRRPHVSWPVMPAATGANWSRPMWQKINTALRMGFGC